MMSTTSTQQSLLQLPRDVLLEVLTNYCTVIDIVKLDTACTSTELRPDLLSLIDFDHNHQRRFFVESLVGGSGFPHVSFPDYDSYLLWKSLRNVKTKGVMTIFSCSASSYYSQGESSEQLFYYSKSPTHWHATASSAVLTANVYSSVEPHGRQVYLESIVFLRAKEGDESGSGHYNGRNPMSVTLSATTSRNTTISIPQQAIPWINDNNHIAVLSCQELYQQLSRDDTDHSIAINAIKLTLKNRYPVCNTPPGHQYSNNGDKLSLEGIELIGYEI